MAISDTASVPRSAPTLEQLITAHQRQIFAFIFSLVHSMADTEDVFQQTCLVMWQKIDEFEPGSDFVAWATAIAKYKAIDFLRAQGRERLQFSSHLQDQLAERAPARSELQEARAEALDVCKQKLSQRDRRTLQACYEQGSTIKEAAARLGRPVGSVYDSLSRIRRLLLECIERALSSEEGAGG